MRKRMLLIEGSAPHWLSVAESLSAIGIDVVYWTAWYRSETSIRAAFPETVFHNTIDAKRGLDPFGEEPVGFEFDKTCEAVWREDAQVVYDQMNRFDHSRDMNMVERSTLFYRTLVYWRHLIRSTVPDIVVFPAPPHVVYDYILLCLCRALGVRTLMFEEVTIYPPYCLAMYDYRQGSPELKQAAAKRHTVSAATRKIASRLRGDYREAKPPREVVAHKARDRALEEGIAGLVRRRDQVEKLEKGKADLQIVNVASLYKEAGKSLRRSYRGQFAGTRYYDQLIIEWDVAMQRRRMYDEMAAKDKDSAPFVYLAFAGQPERTSNPQADILTNQVLIANILSNALPSNWRIWVKEHPNQFHPEFAANMCRSEDYYLALRSIPRVRVVPMTDDPFDTIDGAAIVATSGGTCALEAAARGKPALLFGDAWYRDCPGVFQVRSTDDVRSFMKRYQDGITLAPEEFENYLEAITKGCFRGLADYPPEDYPLDVDENVRSLSSIISNALSDRCLLAKADGVAAP